MELKDIINYADLASLTKADIDKLYEILEIDPPEKINNREYLFDNLSLIFNDIAAKQYFTDKIFCGKMSVKWFKFHFVFNEVLGSKDKKFMIDKLQSDKFQFNKIYQAENEKLSSTTLSTCIKIENNKYLLRFLIPSREKIYNNGIDYRTYQNVKNAIVIIDVDNESIEIRANVQEVKKIQSLLQEMMPFLHISGVMVLNKFNNSLEVFKDSLFNGQFIESSSSPEDINFVQSEENTELLVKTLNLLDEYFIHGDLDKFIESFSEIQIETNGTSFIQLLLAGMDNVGLKMRKDAESDLSNQSLYSTLKKYTKNNKGLIQFASKENGERHTMSVSVTSNSIFFRSPIGESDLKYIRNKVL